MQAEMPSRSAECQRARTAFGLCDGVPGTLKFRIKRKAGASRQGPAKKGPVARGQGPVNGKRGPAARGEGPVNGLLVLSFRVDSPWRFLVWLLAPGDWPLAPS